MLPVTVEAVDRELGTVTLLFDTPNSYRACFEYRTDGDTSQALDGAVHENSEYSELYPNFCLDGSDSDGSDSEEKTFTATEYVEMRHVFGPESDGFFDWETFNVGGCKDGGWEDYEFKNQGQCMRYVNTGQDSRE